MGLQNLRAEERPREKLLKRGAQALTDVELLSIFWERVLRERLHRTLHASYLRNSEVSGLS